MRYRLLGLVVALAAGSTALAETRTLKVNLTNTAGKDVPVSVTLLQIRDAVGAEFPTQFNSIRVAVGGKEVPYQIDDVDGNGRASAADELSFLASGPAEITVSDQAGAAPTYPAQLDVSAGQDGAKLITSKSAPGFAAEVAKTGLVRITGFGDTKALLADELGNLRMSGYPNSTFYKDKALGNHEEKTTLENMTLVESRVLPAGPARVTVVSRYTSPMWVGLEQTVVSRVYANGAVDVNDSVTFRGYSDMMKLEHQATRLMTEADPDAVHITPVFRRVLYADLLKTTPAEFYKSADRNAAIDVNGTTYVQFPANGNLKNPFWGGQYLFASPEAWRTNYSPKLKEGVAEIAWKNPDLAPDLNAFIGGNQWQLESGEFRTGVFKWLPDELRPVDGMAPVFANPDGNVSHYYPGDTVTWHYLYDAYTAPDAAGAVNFLVKRQNDLASVTLTK